MSCCSFTPRPAGCWDINSVFYCDLPVHPTPCWLCLRKHVPYIHSILCVAVHSLHALLGYELHILCPASSLHALLEYLLTPYCALPVHSRPAGILYCAPCCSFTPLTPRPPAGWAHCPLSLRKHVPYPLCCSLRALLGYELHTVPCCSFTPRPPAGLTALCL